MKLRLLGTLLVVVPLLLAGCEKRGPRGGDVNLEDMPSYAELAARHNARVKLLETLYGNGVVGIRWTDEKGRHYEQGDVEIWLRMPSEVALQITKMGERLFWLGANGEASWFFDLRQRGQTFAEISGPTALAALDSDAPLTVSMATLLELMGLAAVPAEKPVDTADITYDKHARAWVLTAEGSAGPLRMFFDVERDLPVRVELLEPADGDDDDAGELFVYSGLPLNSYAYVFVAGRAVDQFPRVPTIVDIVRADETGSLKLTISKPSSDDPSFQEHYFDLDWLLAALQPDEVRDRRRQRTTVSRHQEEKGDGHE